MYRKLAVVFALLAPAWGADLEATLAKVAAYEHGQSRAALVDLSAIVAEAINSPGQASVLEQRLDEFLKSPATLAGKDAVVRQLSLIGTDASVPLLAPMLRAPETSDLARYALERIRGAAAGEALRAALAATSGKVRIGIVNTLAVRRDAQAAPAIAKLLRDRDPSTADAAAAALGQIGGARACASLERAPSRPRVLDARLQCAERSPEAALYRELSAAGMPEPVRIAALGGLKTPAVAAVLGDPSPKVQAAAIRLLAARPGPEVTAKILERLPGAPPPTRVQLVAALGLRGDHSALAPVLGLTKDENAEVRVAALEALGTLGDASTAGLLATVAASGAEAEQAAARGSLYRLRGIDEAVLSALGQAGGGERLELVRACGERGIANASSLLLKLAQDDDAALRREALKALRDTAGAEQVPALLGLLAAARTPGERREAERTLSTALRRSDNSRIGDVLAACEKAAPETRASLLIVLGQSGHKDGLPALRAALKEPHPEVRRAAILGLSEWPTPEPLEDLLGVAKDPRNRAHQVLALRGYVKLAALPAERAPAETVALLATAYNLAAAPEEKKAVLALLPRYATPEALALAESALAEQAVAKEAKAAADRIQRLLADQ